MLRIQSIAHLGNDATVQTVNNKNVINFNAAYTEKYKNAEGIETTKTTWLSCAYWVDRIALAQYLKKGTQVFIDGKPEAKVYTNKDGEVVPQLHVRIISLELLSSVTKPQVTSNETSQKVDEAPF